MDDPPQRMLHPPALHVIRSATDAPTDPSLRIRRPPWSPPPAALRVHQGNTGVERVGARTSESILGAGGRPTGAAKAAASTPRTSTPLLRCPCWPSRAVHSSSSGAGSANRRGVSGSSPPDGARTSGAPTATSIPSGRPPGTWAPCRLVPRARRRRFRTCVRSRPDDTTRPGTEHRPRWVVRPIERMADRPATVERRPVAGGAITRRESRWGTMSAPDPAGARGPHGRCLVPSCWRSSSWSPCGSRSRAPTQSSAAARATSPGWPLPSTTAGTSIAARGSCARCEPSAPRRPSSSTVPPSPATPIAGAGCSRASRSPTTPFRTRT